VACCEATRFAAERQPNALPGLVGLAGIEPASSQIATQPQARVKQI
jgi:hypothetical protein